MSPLPGYITAPAFEWLDLVAFPFALATSLVLAWAGYITVGWRYPGVLRWMWLAFIRAKYRFRVYGADRVPKTGGALIVCNHVSYIDWMLIWAACPRRVTFVLWDGYYKSAVARFWLGWVSDHAIRIDNRSARPHAVADSLRKIAAALDAGHLVLLFPEGRLTRSGHMLPFGRGLELILRRATADVPVIPACTDGMWGSFFSHRLGKACKKWPRWGRPRVAVYFGRPISKALPAADIRLAVQEVTADCAIRQSDYVIPVHRAFVRNAVKFRNLFRPCVVDYATGTERTLTWGKTFVGAVCVARYLRTRLGPEPNVGVWLPTGLGSALANLAAAFLGKTVVNLNYTAGSGPVASAARQAKLRLVVTSKKFVEKIPLELPADIERVYLEDVLASVTKGQRVRTFLMALFLPGWFLDRFVLRLAGRKPDDPITVVFSSGSTGEPKGVILTHRNVGSNVESFCRTLEIRRDDMFFGVLPFFHSFGYTVCLWGPLVSGATALYYPDPRNAKDVGEIARRHKATLFLSTATFLRFYIRRCDNDDFRTLRILICGAEKLPVKTQDEFEAKFGVRPLEGYGCTELSPVVSTNLHDVTVGSVRQVCNTLGTVGQPILGVAMKAFDPDTREPLPVGAEGVLCGKGPNVMAGYLDQPEKTKAAIRDGWYNTGDVGRIEPDGFIRITGRISRFAKIAGEMVPLERLDEELHDILGGGERLLVACAVPDERRGERVVVLYLPDAEGRLCSALASLSSRGIPNLWVPDFRDCYKVESLPALGSGKLDLKGVGELARELAAKR
jgi:acyl-[acyl-carrier-protein]-phospholipid O-acyltransferase/long-chain-fatty-acid--[acyl-carrier-protein] ligase